MYNKPWKKEYISQEKTNEIALSALFKRIGVYEERYGKDLCEMNLEELKSVFIALNIISNQTKLSFKSMMIGYIDWCISTNKTSRENALRLLNVNEIVSPNAIETGMIKSPEEVSEILEKAYPQDYRTLFPNKAVLSQLIFWLLYSGLKDDEISLLKKDDLDIENKTIKSPSRENITHRAFNEVVPLWERFMDIDTIEFEAIGRGAGRVNKLVNNDYLFRYFGNKVGEEHINRQVVRDYLHTLFVKYQEATGMHKMVSITNMGTSGYFYRLMMSARSDEDVKNIMLNFYGSNKGKAYSQFNNYRDWRRYYFE